jgi:F-type H+-transporting ATPase subunit a
MAHDHNPMEHVLDSEREWHIIGDLSWPLPQTEIFGHRLVLTKYMILELVAALLILAIYVPMARRLRDGSLPKGAWTNCFECLLTFVRSEIALPNLGPKDADRFVPFLWTIFLFILFNNLLGMIPVLGSPTASPWMTGGLAIIVFVTMHGAAVYTMGRQHILHPHGHGHGHDGHDNHHSDQAADEHTSKSSVDPSQLTLPAIASVGTVQYLKSLWLPIDVPILGPIIAGALWAIELFSTVIKCGVLAIRLFANMFAGHMVLITILTFIVTAGEAIHQIGTPLWSFITVACVGGVVALSLLELFVAFLQAYVFTFLTALFMGMALHPQH